MDNNSPLRIVAEADCVIVKTPDANGKLRDKITNGPVYSLTVAQGEVRKRKFFYVTMKAIDDQDDSPTADELRDFIETLVHDNHYHDSERCPTSELVTPPPWLLDADSFTMQWNRDYRQEFGDAIEYYLKFGFSDNNQQFMIVSMHES